MSYRDLGRKARTATLLLAAAAAVGCTGTAETAEPPDEVATTATTDDTWRIDDAAWLALRGEPRAHLVHAEEAFDKDAPREVAGDLKVAAALLRIEAGRAIESHVAQRLEGAAIDLTEAGRQALEGTLERRELGRIAARALLAVSEHHRELTGAALADHKPALGSIHLAEATHQLENAYTSAGVEMDAASREALSGARALVARLEQAGSDMAGIRPDTVLVALDRDARRLEYALGARRR